MVSLGLFGLLLAASAEATVSFAAPLATRHGCHDGFVKVGCDCDLLLAASRLSLTIVVVEEIADNNPGSSSQLSRRTVFADLRVCCAKVNSSDQSLFVSPKRSSSFTASPWSM